VVAAYNAPVAAAAKAAAVRDSRSSTASSTSLNLTIKGLPGTRCRCTADVSIMFAIYLRLILRGFSEYFLCRECYRNTCMLFVFCW